MAEIVGALMSSHVPAIGRALERELYGDPYWRPFFTAYPPVRAWLNETKPDVAVVFANDHGLNFFLDKMPTFAIGAADRYENADEGWGLKPFAPVAGEPELSWHLIDEVIPQGFDLTVCQEMLIDHGLLLPLRLFWPDAEPLPIRIVPVNINTVLFPLPSAARCQALGQAIGEAVRRWKRDARVVMIGCGGLSHQLEGERAGFINPEFDQIFMDRLVDDPEWITRFDNEELVELTGSQGVELLNWVAARAAAGGPLRVVHRYYHLPISNTATGLLALAA